MDKKLILSIASDVKTPVLILFEDEIEAKCREFQDVFESTPIYYSLKANSHPSVVSIVDKTGIDFDVASWGEIKILKRLGVDPGRIIYSAPTKLPDDIEKAFSYGIDVFAFDSKLEVQKLSMLAPGAKVVARLAVDNEGSEWPLVRKFGVTNEEAIKLMVLAKECGLKPAGLTFHVGSQNLKAATWLRALERAWVVWIELKRLGIYLDFINVGGGFPVRYLKRVPSVGNIANAIMTQKKKLFGSDVQLYIEPGRCLVGEAGVLVSSVVNRAARDGEEWLYLDTGVYHGLQETIEGFRYEVLSDRTAKRKRSFVLCGPTCDSTDKIMEDVRLPEGMTLDDKIVFLSAGAYTNAYEHYNGYTYPSLQVKNMS